MKFGYARVSKKDQNLDLQISALKEYGVDELYEEKISTKKISRPKLNNLLEKLRAGDSLVVWRLDRLGRTVRQLIDLAENFENKGINFISLKENLDTTTATGRFVFHVFCSMAQMERDIISERTLAGLEAARSKGRYGGRKPISADKIDTALKMYRSNEFSLNDILKTTRISKTTLYKYIKTAKAPKKEKGNGENG